MIIRHLFCTTLAFFWLVSPVCLAQKTFDSLYGEARVLLEKKQYRSAIQMLQNAKESQGVDSNQISRANALIARATREMNMFELSKEAIYSPFSGCVDSVHVEAGQSWSATVPSGDDWISLQAIGDDFILVQVHPSKEKEMRSGLVTVSMGKQKKEVRINQERRPDTRRTVRLETSPASASIRMDSSSNRSVSPWAGELGPGRHSIRIEKAGYSPIDTVLLIEDDLSDKVIPLKFKLKRLFGTFRFQIEPEKGFRFNSDPTIVLNGDYVHLSDIRNSYDSGGDVRYLTLYEDGSIPVTTGRYRVSISSDGFKPFIQDVDFFDDMDTLIRVTLEPRVGLLSVFDEGGAVSASVLVDGEKVGEVPLTDYRIGIGKHVLSLSKDGYLFPEKSRDIVIEENEKTVIDATMSRFAQYSFSSDPERANVYDNDVHIGRTPLECSLMAGEHQIRIEKDGYRPLEETIVVDGDDVLHELSWSLTTVHPLLISSDVDSLLIVVRRGDDVFSDTEKTPARVYIPFSNKPYRLELFSASRKKPVYRGPFYFRGEEKTNHKVLTYSNGVTLLELTTSIYDPTTRKVSLYNPRVGFLKFPLFPGMSISLLKGTAIGLDENPSVFSMFHQDGFLLGVSFLTNPEFRIGGRILENLDMDVLGAFNWYPRWTSMFANLASQAPYIASGIDYFAGGELLSRYPVLSFRLKAGVQWYRLEGLPETLYNKPLFVVSLGFGIGDNSAKGENMIRLF